MAKKNKLQVADGDVFAFDDIEYGDMGYDDAYDEDTMLGAMNGMLEASNHQLTMAIELTKLIVANNPVKNMEDHVFSVFKKATKVISENSTLKNIMDQIER
jgi:hypothetical protein